jgi:hypothetical protein
VSKEHRESPEASEKPIEELTTQESFYLGRLLEMYKDNVSNIRYLKSSIITDIVFSVLYLVCATVVKSLVLKLAYAMLFILGILLACNSFKTMKQWITLANKAKFTLQLYGVDEDK